MREPVKSGPVRCAIYTRKSTEDGLEQEFNSLDAQREAGAAFILSQRHEGWIASDTLYDDGGFSGGNMVRPGLKQLMADVAAGKVDVIVVYKVDRLTRTLADFAKIVDVLDAAGASFVSVTQSFNTTTSMGRLTLNVLLSFAQFEREVTGERIRDKIAASKKKGMWMGGPVPLGYDVLDRKLVVNTAEAETVRHIMQRYLDLGSVRALIAELAGDRRLTKVQHRTGSPHRGGVPFARGTLYHLLKNRIYRGKIVHKGIAHAGEHQPIVDEALWDSVQQKLADGASLRQLGSGAEHPSLLIGMVSDGLGRAMTPSHAVKGSKRYRYYNSQLCPHSDQTAWRVSGHDLERILVDRLASFLGAESDVERAVGSGASAAALQEAIGRAKDAAIKLRSSDGAEHRVVLLRLKVRAVLHEDRIDLRIDLAMLNSSDSAAPFNLTTPAVRIRQGHQLKLVVAPPATLEIKTDARLIQLVADAHWLRLHLQGRPDESVSSIAAKLGRCRGDLADQLRISHLAPDIIIAILAGAQPQPLTRKRLASTDLPLDWADQRRVLGFAALS
jgi:site-specific DNA recombinase